ncbi:MAG TPA: response regulator [Polyangia bacterium]|nr:response regulator [Polyangia bacterium]
MSPARKSLRLLLAEDSEDDEALVLRALRAGGYDVQHLRVESAAAMGAALDAGPWDIVISDYHMPGFSAPEAFRVLRERGLDVPFIIVSGTVGEEVAVDAMRLGLHDYLLKGNLLRLVPAIEREMREAALRAERRQMQEELLIADRMSSVGVLAAGIGHEINNPLAAAYGNLEVAVELVGALEREVRTTAPEAMAAAPAEWQARLAHRLNDLAAPLRDALDGAEQVRVIVRDLRLFSRASDEELRRPVDVRRMMESTLRMAWNEIRQRARLVRAYGEVPPVLANESRLGQIFLNLVMNAAQAIPTGNSEGNEIHVSTSLAGDRVAIEVRDTGAGIPPEVLPKVFDAFFTTKPIGVGTGLGLTICHRLVSALGGSISVESNVGEGSSFRVLLPAAQNPLPTGAGPSKPVEPAPGRRARIAVIDDDASVAIVVARLLGARHDVLPFLSARQALAEVRGGGFDVILCDLMMPDFDGMDFHAELARANPELLPRLVMMTAGAFTPRARAFFESTTNPRLEKPFDRAKLLAVVAALVDGGSS